MSRFFYDIARDTRAMWIKEYAHVRIMIALYGATPEYTERLRKARAKALEHSRQSRIFARQVV